MHGVVELTLTDARDASAKHGVAPRQRPRRGETDGGAAELQSLRDAGRSREA